MGLLHYERGIMRFLIFATAAAGIFYFLALICIFSRSGHVTTLAEFHKWRRFDFALLLLAPIVSSCVLFNRRVSMAIGIFLVGIIIHIKVFVVLLVGIDLGGTGFVYWLIRTFFVAEDGSVGAGLAQFVKWALLVVGAAFIFQSTFDAPLVTAVLVFFPVIYFLVFSVKWHRSGHLSCRQSLLRIPYMPPVEGASHPTEESTRKALSEWVSSPEFLDWKGNGLQALFEWASSPEFLDWVMKNRGQICNELAEWATPPSPHLYDWMRNEDGWKETVEWATSPPSSWIG